MRVFCPNFAPLALVATRQRTLSSISSPPPAPVAQRLPPPPFVRIEDGWSSLFLDSPAIALIPLVATAFGTAALRSALCWSLRAFLSFFGCEDMLSLRLHTVCWGASLLCSIRIVPYFRFPDVSDRFGYSMLSLQSVGSCEEHLNLIWFRLSCGWMCARPSLRRRGMTQRRVSDRH